VAQGALQENEDLPTQADPLAFAGCMAAFGWVNAPGFYGVVDEVEYKAANAKCKTPVEGESVEASYCRFLHSIFDAGVHLPMLSITGIPNTGSEDSRRAAAVRLYDEALQIAPTDLHPDLEALREGFRQSGLGGAFPSDAGERMSQYHLGVCGAFVYLGSLD
jgi:hypothetical protein